MNFSILNTKNGSLFWARGEELKAPPQDLINNNVNINNNSSFFQHFFYIKGTNTGQTSPKNRAHPNNIKALNAKHIKNHMDRYQKETVPIKMALWNARSLNDMTKINFLRIRREDIIIINETWLREEPPSLSGYQCLYKNRPTPQTDDNGPDLNKEQKPDKLRGGGVAIYVDQNIHVKEIETEIKETLFLKISFNRNKCIYLITSYFPHKLEKKWDIRMRQILEKALEKCNENGLRNIVFAGTSILI